MFQIGKRSEPALVLKNINIFLEHSYYLSKTKLILILITVKIKIHFFKVENIIFILNILFV